MIYFLFFCSGVSGLIYQVVWVRAFGNAFGNTIHSASLIVALFMLGLGAGSYLLGGWADRRYAARPDSLLRVYAYVEGVIAALGLGVSLLLPHLARLSPPCRRTRLVQTGGTCSPPRRISPASWLELSCCCRSPC